jgi:hypothetical protein
MRLAHALRISCLLFLLGCPADDDPTSKPDASPKDGAVQMPGFCVERGGNCSGGKKCCADLACCRGASIPTGQEFCEVYCPVDD